MQDGLEEGRVTSAAHLDCNKKEKGEKRWGGDRGREKGEGVTEGEEMNNMRGRANQLVGQRDLKQRMKKV